MDPGIGHSFIPSVVVEGTVMGGELVETSRNRDDPDDFGICAGYTMHLERIFKNGSNPLAVHNGTFFVVMPVSESDCGRRLYAGKTYIIAGKMYNCANSKATSFHFFASLAT
ncbi:hypothetical protein CHS0354_013606 [Potamilus streckersoni]|uniref:Uncharacterized protein n=1 Tax=Potamilus streckersoni TaxID=2493646 RepID=A0AAE0SLF8_9BIVA|nr:hypothetical protein CHS0354_013606 [Potamilus streckersoni]